MKGCKETFVAKVLDKFPERKFLYDYSLVEYVNSKKKVKIICKDCGVFEQTPSKHLYGNGCPNCRRVKQEDIIECAKSLGFMDVDLTEYKNVRSYVDVSCKCGFTYKKQVRKLLEGIGCPKCSSLKTQDTFIKQVYQVRPEYDYSEAVYKGAHTHVKVICKKHGAFTIAPTHLLSGKGCRDCALSRATYYNTTIAERRRATWQSIPCCLYLLEYGGFYKLGVSTNITSRLDSLRRSYKGSVKLLNSWQVSKYDCVILESHLLDLLTPFIANHSDKFQGYTETFFMEEDEVSNLTSYIDSKVRTLNG